MDDERTLKIALLNNLITSCDGFIKILDEADENLAANYLQSGADVLRVSLQSLLEARERGVEHAVQKRGAPVSQLQPADPKVVDIGLAKNKTPRLKGSDPS